MTPPPGPTGQTWLDVVLVCLACAGAWVVVVLCGMYAKDPDDGTIVEDSSHNPER